MAIVSGFMNENELLSCEVYFSTFFRNRSNKHEQKLFFSIHANLESYLRSLIHALRLVAKHRRRI